MRPTSRRTPAVRQTLMRLTWESRAARCYNAVIEITPPIIFFPGDFPMSVLSFVTQDDPNVVALITVLPGPDRK
ncbi:MAG TPA: hypothetical protein VKE98_22550, partial [Gemmataceae bacterium]|nr:hypothetical protein [Gemmataceae bacterium]